MMYWEANVMSHPHLLSLLASVMIFPFMVWGQPWWLASWMPTLPLKFPDPYCHLPSDAFNFRFHFSAHWPFVIYVIHWTLSVLVTEGCGYFKVCPDSHKQLYFASLSWQKKSPQIPAFTASAQRLTLMLWPAWVSVLSQWQEFLTYLRGFMDS